MRESQQSDTGAAPVVGTPYPQPAGAATIPFAERLTCSIAEACQASGLGRTKLYELIGEKQVATTTVGRRRLILVPSLRSLLLGEAGS
jgi:hypothetical protein